MKVNNSTREFGSKSFRNRIESSFLGLVFIASTVFYVGGSVALFLSNTPTVA